MPTPWRRGALGKVKYVVVERDGVREERHLGGYEEIVPSPTLPQPRKRSNTRRQAPSPTNAGDDSDNDDDDDRPLMPSSTPFSTTTISPSATLIPGPSTFSVTTTVGNGISASSASPSSSSVLALADKNPTQTAIAAMPRTKSRPQDRNGISQTTEHLLIAAGSIGATIIIVMVILALYTMRKRGLTFKDVIRHGRNQVRRGPPTPPSKYDMEDNKQQLQDDFRRTKSIFPPQLARTASRSASFTTQTPLRNLGRSDSFGLRDLERHNSHSKSFYDDSESRSNAHRRNESATPSSPVLPIQGSRQSASTQNTRSLVSDEETLRYSDGPADRALPPAPPTFRQFLSNRPTISQRSGLGGGIASRFSWTNSNAPQTPREPTRDTLNQAVGRDSFVTTRSSVPRFRTVDSWVDQQSNRVEAQRLKQQFRMTQSTTSSDGIDDIDEVPEMPAMPTSLQRKPSGLAGKDIKHQRQNTTTSVQTAPIFRVHPGTEVRFSVRSTVPSEVLDMGRKNAAL